MFKMAVHGFCLVTSVPTGQIFSFVLSLAKQQAQNNVNQIAHLISSKPRGHFTWSPGNKAIGHASCTMTSSSSSSLLLFSRAVYKYCSTVWNKNVNTPGEAVRNA